MPLSDITEISSKGFNIKNYDNAYNLIEIYGKKNLVPNLKKKFYL